MHKLPSPKLLIYHQSKNLYAFIDKWELSGTNYHITTIIQFYEIYNVYNVVLYDIVYSTRNYIPVRFYYTRYN